MFESLIIAHSNIEIRDIVYEALSNQGYQITTALLYKDIFDILKKTRPDYIVLDKEMTSAPMEEFQAKIKTIDAKIKVIILDAQDNTPEAIIAKILKILKENRPPISEIKEAAKEEPSGISFKAKILAVDNEKECVDLIKLFLSKKGFNVDTAISGEEALLKVNTNKPDIVLLDINMYGVDGLMALKSIKSIDKSIIVIMTTSLEEDRVTKEAMRLGADGYLIKPFNFEELEKLMLENALKKRTPQ